MFAAMILTGSFGVVVKQGHVAENVVYLYGILCIDAASSRTELSTVVWFSSLVPVQCH